jgi:hypothetical protein
MRLISLLVLVLAIAAAALFVRYGAFDPCRWLRHDVRAFAEDRAGPLGEIGAAFAQRLEGFPRTPGRCLQTWVEFHTAEGDDKIEVLLPEQPSR